MPSISSLSKLSELKATQHLSSLMKKASIPGMSIAVISNGRIWVSALGEANAESKEPVTNETAFEAASLSKTAFTYLVKKMNFPLDKPFSEILSQKELESVLKSQSLDHIPEATEFNAKMVLSHQTGLPNFGNKSKSPLETGKFKYSGIAYCYLQAIIEKKTGISLNELAKQYVFDPLKMNHSTFGRSGHQATGHDELNHPVKNPESSKENAAASLHTTASDYARLIEAILNDPTSFKEYVEVPDSELSWGLGLGLQKNNIAFHWGDNGISKAFVAINTKDKSAIVYFANSEHGLAIAQDVVTPVVGDMQPTFDWLHKAYGYERYGYERHDSPTRKEMLKGKAAEVSGNYIEAKTHYSNVSELKPDDNRIKHQIQNLNDLIKVKANPINVDSEILKKYAGQYDEIKIAMDEEGHLQLVYGITYHLIPLSENKFAVKNDATMQVEFITDDNGNGTKLLTHFLLGPPMETPRNEEELTASTSVPRLA